MATPTSASADTTLPSMTADAPAHKVFSIPELAEYIGRYLRPYQRLKLCPVSRTLYQAYRPAIRRSLSSFAPASPEDSVTGTDVMSGLRDIHGQPLRVRTLILDLHDKNSNPRQRALLDAIYQHFGTTTTGGLHSAVIEYWGTDLAVLEEMLVKLPGLQELSITFMASVNINTIPKTLIAARRTLRHPLHLKSLTLDLRVNMSEGNMDWPIFKRALRACPELRSLDLTGMSFLRKIRGPFVWEQEQDDEDDDELNDQVDTMKIAAEGDASQGTGSNQQQQRQIRPNSHVMLETLKLRKCSLTEERLLNMDKLFPNLKILEMTACDGPCLSVLTDPPSLTAFILTAADTASTLGRVTFAEIRKLTLWIEYQSARTNLVDLVHGRKHLTSVEIDVLPIARSGLFEFAEYCSTPGPFPFRPAVDGETVAIRNNFKRLAIQTYASPPISIERLQAFYGAVCFRELEYIFMQTRDLNAGLFPFASTLRHLYLGGKNALLDKKEVMTLNEILLQLPALEVLRIDRYLDDYGVFAGLGHEPAKSSLSVETDMVSGFGRSGGFDGINELATRQQGHTHLGEDEQQQQGHDLTCEWLKEGPFLQDLELYICLPKGGPLGLDKSNIQSIFASSAAAFSAAAPVPSDAALVASDGKTLSLEGLKRQVVDRFPFLERLKLHVPSQLQLPEGERLVQWREEVWKERGIRFPLMDAVVRSGST